MVFRAMRSVRVAGETLRSHLSRPLLRFRVGGTVALHLVMDGLVLLFVLLGLDAGG